MYTHHHKRDEFSSSCPSHMVMVCLLYLHFALSMTSVSETSQAAKSLRTTYIHLVWGLPRDLTRYRQCQVVYVSSGLILTCSYHISLLSCSLSTCLGHRDNTPKIIIFSEILILIQHACMDRFNKFVIALLNLSLTPYNPFTQNISFANCPIIFSPLTIAQRGVKLPLFLGSGWFAWSAAI